MQSVGKGDYKKGFTYSTSNSAVTCPLWSSTGSPDSSVSKNWNLNINSPTQIAYQLNRLGQKLKDRDSSSTQSSDQSYQEIASTMAGHAHKQFIFIQSGCQSTDGKRVDEHVKSILSLGNPEMVYSPAKADHSRSVVQIPYPYMDSSYGEIMPPCGQHAYIHSQMMGIPTTSRVPLPLQLSEDGPIYVNAKQYRGILRRRQLRAKLEVQNKVVKCRKPYLHESRHLHAMKRVRGSGGRFLNTKQLQQAQQNQQQQFKSSVSDADGKFSDPSSDTSGSRVTSIANNVGMFQLSDPLRFAEFRLHMGGSIHRGMQGGINVIRAGSPHEVPAIK